MIELVGKVFRVLFAQSEAVYLPVGFESQKGKALPERAALAEYGWGIRHLALGELTLVSEERRERFAWAIHTES